jgi:hypothetical protein
LNDQAAQLSESQSVTLWRALVHVLRCLEGAERGLASPAAATVAAAPATASATSPQSPASLAASTVAAVAAGTVNDAAAFRTKVRP